jgi:IPT/TIG domain
MATTCFIPILGKRMRITQLDTCANLPAGGTVDQVLVTDGFITANLSSEVEEGAEIVTKLASGALCVNEKLVSSFKRFTVDLTFCGVNPSLLSMVSNALPYADYTPTNIAGFRVKEGLIDKNFAFELWTGISGAACLPGQAFQGGYMLLPNVKAGVLGDITVDGENAVTFSLKGAYTRGGNTWGIGPYNVLNNLSSLPAQLPTAVDPFDHLLLVQTSLAPPASACSPTPMPPYVTSVTPATGLAAGGTAVVILGSGFTGSTAVSFGGTTGTAFTLVNDGRINVTTAAHAVGTVDMIITRTGGNITKTGAFIYT